MGWKDFDPENNFVRMLFLKPTSCAGEVDQEGKTNQEAKYRYQMVKPGFGEAVKNAKKWMHLKGIQGLFAGLIGVERVGV